MRTTPVLLLLLFNRHICCVQLHPQRWQSLCKYSAVRLVRVSSVECVYVSVLWRCRLVEEVSEQVVKCTTLPRTLTRTYPSVHTPQAPTINSVLAANSYPGNYTVCIAPGVHYGE